MKRDAYNITFSSESVPDVVVLPGGPVTAGNYGGWTTQPRQRKVALTQWQGKDPISMDVPVLFDGWQEMDGQEMAISRLSRMALPPEGGGEPPTVGVSGNSIPNLGPKQWVISGIDWGTNVIAQGGIRYRQDAVVHLLQYVADDRVAFRDVTLASAPKKTGWPKNYVVKKGDTLQKIAAKYYGSASKWRKIGNANGIRDGKNVKVGRSIRIPAP